MYLEWMGKNRAFVEKFIRYANTYAAVYKKEALYGTDIPISFEQVQVLEYLLENEQLNQNMSMIASRLGITPSNFTRIVNKLSGKNFNDVCDSVAVIGKLFDGIFEKQSKCCCLLRINQLFHVAEIYILFSNQESIFSMYFYFELFRAAGVSSV